MHDTREEATPSLEDWKALYQAAKEFHALAPWEWMWDSDLFGVQDPVTGEVIYACVLGNQGEVFALVGNLGSEGLAVYNRTLSGEIGPDNLDAITAQKCLLASFENRADIGKEDYAVIRQLGLRFRGRNAWPLFRSYQPGFFPWHLTTQEVNSLTVVLGQTIEVAQRMAADPEILIPPEDELYLVRVPQDRNGMRWKDEWQAPAPYEKKEEPSLAPLPITTLKRMSEAPVAKQGIWEVHTLFLPTPIEQESGRPYFPLALLIVKHKNGIILHFDLFKPGEFSTEFQARFLAFLEGVEGWPRALWVMNEDLHQVLLPLAEQLGIELLKVPRLTAVEEAEESLLGFLG
ncbi:MAG: hypothetical protein U9N00_05165 [Candidatus Bipolaricaulota bacterium]|nr:hypothetical protein [Candidatus Bipolaricaulota bacterium]